MLEYKIASKKEDLKKVAESALDQIESKEYMSKINAYPNVKKVIRVGLAFSGKDVEGVFK
ncbi:MAG: hypothetical protein B7Y25_04975 [Alphaproteobacteria bacterium 16-39-46]|nr:MAG: hypothetical protein B7Y25_04975 [Alphaproteobacteria bacterium 16-39-46]OZA42851.1 MAG: hypothetical protein B7X84_04690 [Alphaproteobacteria bacterium 17-39-52]